MRIVIVLFVMVVGCTKQNPQACCTDAVDCMKVGLPEGTDCDDGLLCRGNRCVEVACDVSAQCDVLAPYCANELCSSSCVADTQCPGFAQSATEQFCASGACVQCREGMNDCPVSAPVCSVGACVQCSTHQDCMTGVCSVDGTCASESDIAYVSPNGSATSDCVSSETCNLLRAVQLTPTRQYLLLRPGNYLLSASLSIDGKRSVIGSGSMPSVIMSNATGPIIKLAFGADVTLEFVEVRGARNGASADGFGVEAPTGQNATLRTLRATFSQNEVAGISARQSTLELRDSTFVSNGQGVTTQDTKATIDRCLFHSNTGTAVYLDGGLYTVNNSFITRNAAGIQIYANTSSSIEFNTIVDNTGTGFYCDSFGGSLVFPNNLLARNGTNTESLGCAFANSIIEANNIAPLKFKSPDAAPYDYHLTAGSSALDLAGPSSLTTDFDGESRPFGAANDIGADELH